ncbi:hypothetical protein [Aliirhizobium cellulosilyticum]|uniref:Uncharacterized protein n=1 Tax=Aliirhizobium cellulosilyticum TaxID=393664 RepID=A0A7W6Y2D5_9HYPH|nr:hypothetical protein [Rhizobium cellulosilyticum]MBB4349433.1 hypothetical protein [Rhizobium cellulosilyticum]MBB4412345.1 hypothetical protein [Rhizobium cellulosilyticum]MBB4446976.1 hypothetical protein [Rhizobium cellulosilyticum]
MEKLIVALLDGGLGATIPVPVALTIVAIDLGLAAMGKKLDAIHDLLIEGASRGLSAHELYVYVRERCEKVPIKRVQKAALRALSSEGRADRQLFEELYSFAAYAKIAR